MTFAQWQTLSHRLSAQCERISRSRMATIRRLCASVQIPVDGCCIHNASIDDDMRGWCYGNRHRLRVAKQIARLWNACPEHRIAERISARAWSTVQL